MKQHFLIRHVFKGAVGADFDDMLLASQIDVPPGTDGGVGFFQMSYPLLWHDLLGSQDLDPALVHLLPIIASNFLGLSEMLEVAGIKAKGGE